MSPAAGEVPDPNRYLITKGPLCRDYAPSDHAITVLLPMTETHWRTLAELTGPPRLPQNGQPSILQSGPSGTQSDPGSQAQHRGRAQAGNFDPA
jgi:hypothetical protein